MSTMTGRGLLCYRREVPIVSYALLFLIVAVFVATNAYGQEAALAWGAMSAPAFAAHRYWTLVTANLMHRDILHLASNFFYMLVLGPCVERVLGHGRTLLLYVVSGLSGACFYVWLRTMLLVPNGAIGASGMAFALFGAYVAILARLRRETLGTVYEGSTITMGLLATATMLILMFAYGFNTANIANDCHLFGLVTGCLFANACWLVDRLAARKAQGRAAGRRP